LNPSSHRNGCQQCWTGVGTEPSSTPIGFPDAENGQSIVLTNLCAPQPIQFQKQIRLHEARVRLVADPGNVAGIGFAVGYESPSQFSREYRRMFGAPPSRDAFALREGAALPTVEPQRKGASAR
jgi:AraC-like DNA-binding protein